MDIVEAAARFAAEDSYVAAKVREAERKRLFATTDTGYVGEAESLKIRAALGRQRSGETSKRKAAERRAARAGA